MLLAAISESIDRAFPQTSGNADNNFYRIRHRLQGGLTLTRLPRTRLLIDNLDRLPRREALRTAHDEPIAGRNRAMHLYDVCDGHAWRDVELLHDVCPRHA